MLVLQSLLTRRLQTAAIFFQRIFCGLRTPFWLLRRLLSSRLSGRGLDRAHVEAASCLQSLSQCRACVKSERGQVVGSSRQLFFPAHASQTTNPLSACLLSQNAQAYPTQGLGPNYKKEGKPELATDWASWVNVNGNHKRIFYTLRVMQQRLEIYVEVGEASQAKLYMFLWMQTSNNMFFDSIGIVRHHICVCAAIQEW